MENGVEGVDPCLGDSQTVEKLRNQFPGVCPAILQAVGVKKTKLCCCLADKEVLKKAKNKKNTKVFIKKVNNDKGCRPIRDAKQVGKLTMT